MNFNSYRYDYAKYNSDGSIVSFDDYDYGNLYLTKGQKVIISNMYESDIYGFYVPYSVKDSITVNEIINPALYKFDLEVGKNYRIVNDSNSNVKIENNSTRTLTYDYIRYKEDGSYTSYVNKYGNLTMANTEYIDISPNVNNSKTLTFYLPYKFKNEGFGIRTLDNNISDIFKDTPKITIEINKILSSENGEVGTLNIEDYLVNYNVSIYNQTKNKKITGSQNKEDIILLPNGSTEAGDKVTVSLVGKNNDTKLVEQVLTMDDNNQSSSKFNIVQLGFAKINYQKEVSNDNSIRTIVFDESGKNVEIISTSKESDIRTKYLQEGQYSIVALRSNGNLWRFDNLNEIKERGLVEGVDYLKSTINIKDGIIETISLNKIPTLDEERISFF